MVDYDDSDEELGAYIYRTSHTAQLLREAAARNDEMTTNNNTDTNIHARRWKRKKPPEVQDNISVSSEPKERTKKMRKKCVMKDVPIKLSKEEFVSDMVPK